MRYDCVIVGAGSSGIFAAMELRKLKPAWKIALLEQGEPIENRKCSISKIGKCAHCKPFCHITSGFSGAGAFSDGKLSLIDEDATAAPVGGELEGYLGLDRLKELVKYVDGIFLKFGADERVVGLENREIVEKIRKKAKEFDVNLVSIPIRHLGTDNSRTVFAKIQAHLHEIGVDVLYRTDVKDVIIKNGEINGVTTEKGDILAPICIISVGRKGAKWMFDLCHRHKINSKSGIVDIGIRYELTNNVMREINRYMYEGKFIAYPPPFRDKVRTFCQNPGGFVTTEVYDNGLTVANGHSYKNKKSENTNLAILVSHAFAHPFDQPIKFGRNIVSNANDLGAGNVLVQRFGDILRGKRTWQHELVGNTVQPTLPTAVAGDVTSCLPYRTMTDIIEFITTMDKIIHDFAHPDNLLYAPEVKFYSNKVEINEDFCTNIRNLYCIGDTGGLTRGLIMAACSGVQVATKIAAHS